MLLLGFMLGRATALSWGCPWVNAFISYMRLRIINRSAAEDLQGVARLVGVPLEFTNPRDSSLLYTFIWISGAAAIRRVRGGAWVQ